MSKLVSVIIVTRNRKKELVAAISSILKSSYKKIEVIIVDNHSDFDIKKHLPKKIIDKVHLIRSGVNLGAAGGRNLGSKSAKGDYLLFFDDDVIADFKMVEELAFALSLKKNYVIASPKIYDLEHPDTLQAVGHWVNMYTGRIGGWGVFEKDKGQYEKIMKIPMAGGVLLCTRKIFTILHGFDEIFFIPYEDSDFTFRATNRGYDVIFVPKAICHHPSKKSTMPKNVQMLGIASPERAYRTLRNKIILIRKNGKWYQWLIFLIIFSPIYLIAHTFIIIKAGQFKTVWYYWKGFVSGLSYVFRRVKYS